MKFWSVQKWAIVQTALENGFYQADFSKSNFTREDPRLNELYSLVRDAFNRVNGTNVPGVLFSFLESDNQTIYSPQDIYAFYVAIQRKQAALKTLWRKLCAQDSVVLELDYEEGFNPILIDLNDFQFLMPPIWLVPPYTEEDVARICRDIYDGRIMPSIFPSGIIQAHLPYLKKENITRIFPMFDLLPGGL